MATRIERNCHLCHKPVTDIIQCTKLINNNPCDCIFCPDCIKNEFNEDIYNLKRKQSTYICFRCRGLCECEQCKKERETKSVIEPKPIQNKSTNQPIQNTIQSQPISQNKTEMKQSLSLERQNQKREEIKTSALPKSKKQKNTVFNNGDYSNHFVFHVAIYSSLSPSQGVTLNCVSTNDDIKTLEKANVIPSFSYSYHCLFHQTINICREE